VDRVSGHHSAHVDRLEREVPSRLDAAQVGVGTVGAGDVRAWGHAEIEEDRHLGADRPDVAGWPELV